MYILGVPSADLDNKLPALGPSIPEMEVCIPTFEGIFGLWGFREHNQLQAHHSLNLCDGSIDSRVCSEPAQMGDIPPCPFSSSGCSVGASQ